jgi:hypothetical protein
MSWISKGLGIAILGLCMSAPMSATLMAAQVVVGSRVVVGPRVIVRSYAPFGWYGYGYGYWGPGWVYPAYPVYAVRPNTGEVKIDTDMKDASLYIDSGFVGPVRKFKKVELRPGNHEIELRDASGGRLFDKRVQVIVGKTVEFRAYS